MPVLRNYSLFSASSTLCSPSPNFSCSAPPASLRLRHSCASLVFRHPCFRHRSSVCTGFSPFSCASWKIASRTSSLWPFGSGKKKYSYVRQYLRLEAALDTHNWDECDVEAEEHKVSLPSYGVDHDRCELDDGVVEDPARSLVVILICRVRGTHQFEQVLNPFVSARMRIGVISAGYSQVIPNHPIANAVS